MIEMKNTITTSTSVIHCTFQ